MERERRIGYSWKKGQRCGIMRRTQPAIAGFEEGAAAAAKSPQPSPTLCDPIDSSPRRLRHPWDSPGKNNGVGCHFLLQCMKVKSESEVAQSCPTLSDPMDCSPSGSSVHGIPRQEYWSGVPSLSPWRRWNRAKNKQYRVSTWNKRSGTYPPLDCSERIL